MTHKNRLRNLQKTSSHTLKTSLNTIRSTKYSQLTQSQRNNHSPAPVPCTLYHLCTAAHTPIRTCMHIRTYTLVHSLCRSVLFESHQSENLRICDNRDHSEPARSSLQMGNTLLPLSFLKFIILPSWFLWIRNSGRAWMGSSDSESVIMVVVNH